MKETNKYYIMRIHCLLNKHNARMRNGINLNKNIIQMSEYNGIKDLVNIKCSYLLNDNYYIIKLVNEFILNNCESDLLPKNSVNGFLFSFDNINDNISIIENNYLIFNILYEKLMHPRNLKIGNYILKYYKSELLALLLYTSSNEANYKMAEIHRRNSKFQMILQPGKYLNN